MSGNARGKLKEEMEGIHRNLEWIRIHSAKAKDLLGETHPELHSFFDALISEMETLDDGAMRIYGTLIIMFAVLLCI